MEISVPYHVGCLLGRSVNMKSLQMGYMLIDDTVSPITPQMNLTTSQFSFINSLKDICEVLQIPPEYALKVQGNVIQDEAVSACLRCIGHNNSFAAIFRVNYLQQKQYLPMETVPSQSKEKDKNSDGATMESLIADATADESMSIGQRTPQFKGTHWVKAMEIGNELITIMRISTPNNENLNNLFKLIATSQECFRGILDKKKMDDLLITAEKIDKKLAKDHYKDVKLNIQYCSFHDLGVYPAAMKGMVSTLSDFMEKCDGWANVYKHGIGCKIEARIMACKTGMDVEKKKKNILAKAWSDWMSGPEQASVAYFSPEPANCTETQHHEDGEDHDSFVVLASGSDYLHFVRATLVSFESGEGAELSNTLSSLAIAQNPGDSYNLFAKLFLLQSKVDVAVDKLQRVLGSRMFIAEDRMKEGREVLKSLQNIQLVVHEAVKDLDMVHMPTEQALENVLSSDPLGMVNEYIEMVTSKLPPGSDLDLLVIGKTGHGKSTTGNSILGQKKFVSSGCGESVTQSSNVGWSNIDGRIIKVVDTPGVCDTNLDTDTSSVDHGIQSISEAIAHCPNGFHALLLIISFAARMTMEEKKTIGLLKCILGEDIIKSHCIVIVTYGDNYKSEVKLPFKEWVKKQGGFLGSLFKECEYRCVLFNNKATDPKEIKNQIIELVSNIDSLKANGTRYTNAIFEFALNERKRIISEQQVPQVKEEMMRDIQLVLDHLNGMVRNTNEIDKYKDELARLKETVDNLSNRMSETGDEKISVLVDTVFSLAAAIHTKIEEIANKNSPDSPEAKGQEEEDMKSISPAELGDFEGPREELQNYFDTNMSPQANKVDDEVTKNVADKVKAEKNCFPANSTVFMENGKKATMEEVQIGDKVLVRTPHGKLMYDEVYMFGHREFHAWGNYFSLETNTSCISLSRDHLIFCRKDGSEVCIRAGDVQLGTELLVHTDAGLEYQEVCCIKQDHMKGRYAPFTMNGTIIVNSMLASCYVDVVSHNVAHSLLWPLRQLYRASPKALASVSRPSKSGDIPWFANLALKVL